MNQPAAHDDEGHDDEGHDDELLELPIVGELGPEQADLHDKLLAIPPGESCTLYFNCSGGDPYTALSLVNIIRYRNLRCTAVVTGECSSAALWPFAACERRIVFPTSFFLFHPCRWESEENIRFEEARQWAQHFETLTKETDALLAEMLAIAPATIDAWVEAGAYVPGAELVRLGCAEMMSWPRP